MRSLRFLASMALTLLLLFSTAQADGLDVNEWYSRLESLVVKVGTRQSFTENEEKARLYLTAEFEKLGYTEAAGTLETQWMATPAAAMRKFGIDRMANLIAIKKAQNPEPTILIVSAHYDSMSSTLGAKDNGSGVAALLTIANAFSKLNAFPDTELRFIAFTAEEKGEYGSGYYSMEMTAAERERTLGVFNIDLITMDLGAENIALSCNTMGGRTENGYQQGSEEAPMHNRVSLAFEKAFWEEGGYEEADRDVLFCIPRHFDDSDHIRFHAIEVDAANICFQGNVAADGAWPADMHTPEDYLKPYDMERTQHALNVLYRAVYHLALDHEYGL